MPSTKIRPSDAMLDALRAFGLQYPGAHTTSPWPGHLDLAVNGKTFAYLSVPGEPFVMSCKLPNTSELALTQPHTKPTSYGLGHSGWVTVEYPDDQLPPIALLQSWLDESYRAQAPKQLVTKLDATSIKAKSVAAATKTAKTVTTIKASKTAKAKPGNGKIAKLPAAPVKAVAKPKTKAAVTAAGKRAIKLAPARKTPAKGVAVAKSKKVAKKR